MRALWLALLVPSLALGQATTAAKVQVCTRVGVCAAPLNSSPVGTEYGLPVRMVGAAAGGTSSNFGAAFPSAGTAAGAKVVGSPPTYVNGNMEAPTLDTAGLLRVNVVAGGAGGGNAQLQVYDGTAWDNVSQAAQSATVAHLPVALQGSGANIIEPLNGAPAGTEYALPTRQVGTATVSGTVTVGTFPDNEPFNLAQVGGTATTADNASAGSTNMHVLPGIVETSSTPPTRTDGSRAAHALDSDGRLYVRTHDWDPLSATSGLSTATALTQLIAAPGASVSVYITDIVFSASVAATTTADQQMTLKRGTGTNCVTGTTYVWGAFNPANGGAAVHFAQPIKIAANEAVCWIHAAAGSKIVTVNYFLAP